ncbi:MAG: hypothetical protein AABX00_04605 [Nanoarchaeota archaeon]
MTEGWLTRWYSKFIKIPFFLRRQMRKRGRIIEHLLPRMKSLIYEKIPDEVLREHRVTKAMKDQVTLVKEGKKVERAETDLGFDEQVEETLTLKEVKEIETTLLRHEEQHGSIGYEAEFGKDVLDVLISENEAERDIYFTYLEPIIKLAEKSGDRETVREIVRLLGSTQTNLFASIALRLDIRASGKGIPKLRADKAAIKKGLALWDTHKDKPRAEGYLRDVLAQTKKDIEATLHSDALVAKRDFLLVILTLKYLNDEEGKMEEYYIAHVMPKIPEDERIKDIEKLKHEFSEDMHVLAQGMRRIFSAEKEAEALAQQIQAVARTKRARAA